MAKTLHQRLPRSFQQISACTLAWAPQISCTPKALTWVTIHCATHDVWQCHQNSGVSSSKSSLSGLHALGLLAPIAPGPIGTADNVEELPTIKIPRNCHGIAPYPLWPCLPTRCRSYSPDRKIREPSPSSSGPESSPPTVLHTSILYSH